MQLKIPLPVPIAIMACALTLTGCGDTDAEDENTEDGVNTGTVILPLELGDSCDDLLAGRCYQLRGVIRIYTNEPVPVLLWEIPTPDGMYTTPSNWDSTSGLPVSLPVGDYLFDISNGVPCTPQTPASPPFPEGNCYRLYDCTAANAGRGVGGVVGCDPIQDEAVPTDPAWPLIPFTITAGQVASPTFQFRLGDELLTFESGNVEVTFDLTPLNNCPEGEVSSRLNSEEDATCRQTCYNNSQCPEDLLCLMGSQSSALQPDQGVCAQNLNAPLD